MATLTLSVDPEISSLTCQMSQHSAISPEHMKFNTPSTISRDSPIFPVALLNDTITMPLSYTGDVKHGLK